MKFPLIGALCSGSILLTACSSIPPLVAVDTGSATESNDSAAPVNQSRALSLASISARVKANNPQLRAARLRIDEARGQVVQSGRLSNPELSLDLSKSGVGSEAGIEIGFAQRFPVTNRLGIEKRISRQQLEIAKEEVKSAQNALSTEAQLIAVEILHNRQRVTQLKRQVEQLSEFANFIDQAAKRGELSSLDANQAKVESATVEANISRLQTTESILLNTLKSYIGLRPSSQLSLSGSLPKTQLPSVMLALNNRPEYRAKLLEIEQSQQQLALQKANRYEDVEGRAFTSVERSEDAPEGIETEGTIGVGISIPLQFYSKNQGNIQSATARSKRISSEKSALALAIQQEAANARAEMKSWLAQSQSLTSRLIPLADDNVKQFETAYRNGQTPFTSVLTARSQQLTLQSQNIDNLEAFHKARVRYFAAIGRTQSAL